MSFKQGILQVIRDVKEKNMAGKLNFCDSLNNLQVLVFCVDTQMCRISKAISLNKENEICLPNKEYIRCH